MLRIETFTFNPFGENTSVLIADNKDCIIVDAGMYNASETQVLADFVDKHALNPLRLILTHAHIDHVLGAHACHRLWGLEAECHEETLAVWHSCEKVSQMYGVPYTPGPEPKTFLDVQEALILGDETFELRFVPGHCPGHIVLVHHESKSVIAGDTLFEGSIGRTDLPGGNHELLLEKIRTELYSLPDDYTVYPGHGNKTTIGAEKSANPFVRPL